MKRAFFLFLLLLSPSLWAQKLAVIVSVLPQKAFVEAVGGDAVAVQVLVGKGYDPATYQPKPQQISGFARARLFVRAGLPFEAAWLPRLKAINAELQILDMREGLKLLHSDHGAQDPHIWTDPLLVQQHAKKLQAALSALRPEKAQYFAQRQREFSQRLQQLHRFIQQRLKTRKGSSFLVFHPAWSYFAWRYGLHQLAIEREGKEPNARSLARLIDRARKLDIHQILVQPQHNSASAQVIANALDARLVLVDPLAADYFPAMRHLAEVLSREHP